MISHREYRRLRELLKYTLRTNRIGSPDEYLSSEQGAGQPGLTPSVDMTTYENPLPESVKRQAARADTLLRELSAGLPRRENDAPARPMVMWITDATLRPRRPHRRTHKPPGRPRKNENDKAAEAAFGAAIAAAIDQLVRLRGMKKTAARRLVAATLSDHAFKNTYAAAQKLTDPATRRAVHQGEWKAVEASRSRLGRVLRKIDK